MDGVVVEDAQFVGKEVLSVWIEAVEPTLEKEREAYWSSYLNKSMPYKLTSNRHQIVSILS